jgi:hypothetical protein
MTGINTTRTPEELKTFERELESLINSHCVDVHCDTPDFMLAAHLLGVIQAIHTTTISRDKWLGRKTASEQISTVDPTPAPVLKDGAGI